MNTPDTLKKDAENIRKSGDFDADWYLKTYPDVGALGMDPAEHYLQYGRMLGRNPGPSKRPEAKRKATDDGKRDRQPPSGPMRTDARRETAVDIDILEFTRQSYAEYTGPKTPNTQSLPVVSVIMTSHNAEDTIERSVETLLNQNYPNLEVVICDDASTDNTWNILTGLQLRTGGSVKAIRLATNSGTYLAKNVAIGASRGEILLFQDSDDYSHPERVMVQVLPLVADPALVATRTKYARFDSEKMSVIKRGGHLARYGLITLAVRREIFRRIGYFDAVRKAGDDEWYRRMLHIYGVRCLRDLDVSLYLAELRVGSLIADMVTVNSDGSIEQKPSEPRKRYVTQLTERFAAHPADPKWFQQAFPIAPIRPQQVYPAEIAAITRDYPPIICSLCSVPGRETSLARAVGRLIDQVDQMFVYLDKYAEVPDFLQREKISVFRSDDFSIDYRDNAKFLHFNDLKQRFGDFYFFTCDDDIIYPFDYVRTMLASLETFSDGVVVGLHGAMVEERPQSYFGKRTLLHFEKDDIFRHEPVNILGTGTTAFHSSLFPSIDVDSWGSGGMVDIVFASLTKRTGIPMVSICRHAGWMKDNSAETGEETLFNEFSKKEGLILDVLRQNEPWGWEAISETLAKCPPDVRRSLEALCPVFIDEVTVATTYRRYRRDRKSKMPT